MRMICRISAYIATVMLSISPCVHCATALADATDTRLGIADTARKYLKATDWEPDFTFNGDTGYYCNEFVSDVIEESGAKTWEPIQRDTLFPLFREPLSSEWADPAFGITGWDVIFQPSDKSKYNSYSDILKLRQPGDIVSGMGHVGIVSDQPNALGVLSVFSASSKTGAVELNDWSADPGANDTSGSIERVARFTVRRFVGGS